MYVSYSPLISAPADSVYSTLSMWMYQFWLFSFKKAKHWGRGPHDWIAGILGFDDYRQRKAISTFPANTPGRNMRTPESQTTPREDDMIDATLVSAVKKPSSCANGAFTNLTLIIRHFLPHQVLREKISSSRARRVGQRGLPLLTPKVS